MHDAFQQIVKKINPTAQLTDFKKLEGGVSAQVFALDAQMSDGTIQKLVVRQYGDANLKADSSIATHEYQLLESLYSRGLPVPKPYLTDESRNILPSPYLVAGFIDGQTIDEPANAIPYVQQMAEVLAKIHEVEAPSFLPDQQGVFTDKLAERPQHSDESLSESEIRETLARHWPPQQQNHSVLLHGDFWPGNTMWRDGKLVGVIDWEDAAVGDPLADLSNGRLEILMFFGVESMNAFTHHYQSLAPGLNYDNLPYWDLCASLRPAGQMADWGLDEATLQKLQTGHKQFIDQAMAKLG
jgi:aminoglycoside phosphotransferase (APT) family kinase protein